MAILYFTSIGAIFCMLMVNIIGHKIVGSNNRYSPFLNALIGFVWGAVVGSIISMPVGLALLFLALELTHTSGDQAVGAFGLVVLGIPVGAIIGGGFGAYRAIISCANRASK